MKTPYEKRAKMDLTNVLFGRSKRKDRLFYVMLTFLILSVILIFA